MKKPVALLTALVIMLFMASCSIGSKETSKDDERDDSDIKITVEETKTSESEEVEETEETTEDKAPVSETETSEETTAENVFEPAEQEKIPDGCLEAYIDLVDSLAAEDDSLMFDLIYVNNDDIPELVAGNNGYWVNMYSYVGGEVKTYMDSWPYGAMGNAGYYYCPSANVIYNANADYAGAIRYETYMSMDDNGEIEPFMSGEISYIDEGKDPGDVDSYLEDPNYFLRGEKVNEEQFYAAFCYADLRIICGNKTAAEVKAMLEEGVVPKEHQYGIFDYNVTWEEATKIAESLGGHLVTINDLDEYFTLSSIIWRYGIDNRVFIIGGRREADSDKYLWTEDGSNDEVDIEEWMSGEPSFTGKTEGGDMVEEHYMAMVVGQTGGFKLMDVPNDLIAAAPTYENNISIIVEFE